MVDLIAKTPAEGLLPYTRGDAVLSEIALGQITSIAPFQGQREALEKALGARLPDPLRTCGKAGAEIVWFSQGQFLAFGVDVPDMARHNGALTDQSDAWCALELSGAAAADILARLVPVDLRQSNFEIAHCLRSQLGHMPLHVMRMNENAFRLLSFRSMAGTMVHEISRAMDLFRGRG